MAKPGTLAMTPAKAAHATLNFQRSVRSSTTSIDTSGASHAAVQALLFGSRIHSIWYFTAAALNLEPSWNSTPSRNRIKRSEEHTSELQSLRHLVCRLLLEKK